MISGKLIEKKENYLCILGAIILTATTIFLTYKYIKDIGAEFVAPALLVIYFILLKFLEGVIGKHKTVKKNYIPIQKRIDRLSFLYRYEINKITQRGVIIADKGNIKVIQSKDNFFTDDFRESISTINDNEEQFIFSEGKGNYTEYTMNKLLYKILSNSNVKVI